MMLFLRSLLFSIGMILSVIVYAPISLLTFPAPYLFRYRFILQWSRFILWWAKVTCNIRYEIIGKENIPTEPCIIFCKHQSTWETFALQVFFVPLCTILKKELLNVPFFGWALRLLEPIAIDRNKGKESIKQLLRDGVNRLEQKRWVLIFPEGTRVPAGTTKPFNKGGSILASSSKYPVLPIAHNAGEFWPRRQFLKKPGTIQFCIGPLIHSEELSSHQITAAAEQWINEKVEAISQQQVGKQNEIS